MSDEHLDDVLGITRCARCGHRLEGEIECPFCSMFPERPKRQRIPKWVFLTACFLTSPLSIYFVIKTDRLKGAERYIAASGLFLWAALFMAF
ncbi:MAG: hypothetical protein PVJ36_08715 [Nitrospirota bacterium]|jgi:hypothetical protein